MLRFHPDHAGAPVTDIERYRSSRPSDSEMALIDQMIGDEVRAFAALVAAVT